MANNEFFYWIQGYFELDLLSGNCHGKFNKNQCICILKHTKLVQKNRSENLGKVVALIEAMIEGYLDLDNGTAKIIDIVSEQFEHVIDLEHCDNLDAMKKIHGGPEMMR